MISTQIYRMYFPQVPDSAHDQQSCSFQSAPHRLEGRGWGLGKGIARIGATRGVWGAGGGGGGGAHPLQGGWFSEAAAPLEGTALPPNTHTRPEAALAAAGLPPAASRPTRPALP